MSLGLEKILDKIREDPSRKVLHNRYLALIADIESSSEKARRTVDLARIYQDINPRKSMQLANMVYQSDRENLDALYVIAKSLENLGKFEKAEVIQNEIVAVRQKRENQRIGNSQMNSHPSAPPRIDSSIFEVSDPNMTQPQSGSEDSRVSGLAYVASNVFPGATVPSVGNKQDTLNLDMPSEGLGQTVHSGESSKEGVVTPSFQPNKIPAPDLTADTNSNFNPGFNQNAPSQLSYSGAADPEKAAAGEEVSLQNQASTENHGLGGIDAGQLWDPPVDSVDVGIPELDSMMNHQGPPNVESQTESEQQNQVDRSDDGFAELLDLSQPSEVSNPSSFLENDLANAKTAIGTCESPEMNDFLETVFTEPQSADGGFEVDRAADRAADRVADRAPDSAADFDEPNSQRSFSGSPTIDISGWEQVHTAINHLGTLPEFGGDIKTEENKSGESGRKFELDPSIITKNTNPNTEISEISHSPKEPKAPELLPMDVVPVLVAAFREISRISSTFLPKDSRKSDHWDNLHNLSDEVVVQFRNQVPQNNSEIICWEIVQAVWGTSPGKAGAVFLSTQGLTTKDVGFWGVYLDCLIAAGYSRKAQFEIFSTLSEKKSPAWALASWRRLPAIWRLLGVRGFQWDENEGVNELILKVSQRAIPLLTTMTIGVNKTIEMKKSGVPYRSESQDDQSESAA